VGALIVASVVLSILLARHIVRVLRRRREESFERLAAELRYSLAGHEEAGFLDAYHFLSSFKDDPGLTASMVLSGNNGARRIRAFHLVLGQPSESEDEEEPECVATALVVEWPDQRFPHVRIDPASEGGSTGSLGSPGFSSGHHSVSGNEGFARMLIECSAIEILDAFAPMSLEVYGYAVAFRCGRCLSAGDLRRLHRAVCSFLDRIPDDVLKRTHAD
jgi:hypothetical protein